MSTVLSPPKTPAPPRLVAVLIGRESAGKSQLAAMLVGCAPQADNFHGSTVAVERYESAAAVLVDTPGVLRRSDLETTRLALAELDEHETVLLVVQATQLDDDLHDMLPLVQGKRGAVAVTFWDKVQPGQPAEEAVKRLSAELGAPLIPLDARQTDPERRDLLLRALAQPGRFSKFELSTQAGWRIEPRRGLLDLPVLGPLLACVLLALPALAAILGANRLADLLHPRVATLLEPAIAWVDAWAPTFVRAVLTAREGDFGYGLLNMGPFLLVWALPTVILFALILGFYKASGLIERMNAALHPWVRPFGLSGRDIVRVVMGFGCNVPAVISTRACSGCSRGTAIAAIAFGSACSYQLPATLAVLAAVATAQERSPALLALAYLGYLLLTTLIYLRLTSPREARNSLNILLTPRRPFLQWPTLGGLWREASGTVKQFFTQAMPVFVVICVAASLLAGCGVLGMVSRLLAPVMQAFDLPAEAALPVVMASVRKDGIFLLTQVGEAGSLTATQALTAVYLAGVLLPCLVTTLTIGRETSWRATAGLLLRQATAALVFSLVLAWLGPWILG